MAELAGAPPRRLGVMGGTFDPIHYGHLVAASEVADLFDLDEVVFVPSGQPWQKSRPVSAAEDRYLMTVIATASNPRFSVSRVDIDRAGALHRGQPARLRAAPRAHHRGPGRAGRGCVVPGRDPGAGDLVDRLPSARRTAPPAVVP